LAKATFIVVVTSCIDPLTGNGYTACHEAKQSEKQVKSEFIILILERALCYRDDSMETIQSEKNSLILFSCICSSLKTGEKICEKMEIPT